MAWEPSDPPIQTQAVASTGTWAPSDPAFGAGPPRTAQGFWDSVSANWQASSLGLALRGEAPNTFINPDLPWYDRVGGALAGLAGDIPAMAVGAFAGAAIPSPPAAKPILTGAGAFAAPAAVREALMSYYQTGQVDWGRMATAAGKEAVVGAATFWAGGAVSKMLPIAGAEVSTATRIAQGVGRQAAIGGAELGAMMGARSIVDWRIPEAHEFIDNAVLIFGLRAAREYGVPALMKVYERTGKTPEEVKLDAARNSDIAQEVLQGRVPEAYKHLEIEPRGEVRPEFAPKREPIDPGPRALDRAAHNLRHVADEATMRGEIARAGADHLAAIEAARRGEVSWAKTKSHAEQWSAWLQDTVGPGKKTREVGESANDAQIVGYGVVMEASLSGMRETGVKLNALKAAKDTTPEQLAQARAEHAQASAQLRAVTADYLGATAEVGRALNAIKTISAAAKEAKTLMEAMGKAGYKGWIDHSAEMVASMASNRQVSQFVRATTKFDKVVEWWKASVLSGPTTQTINFLSNTAFSLSRVPRTLAAAAISEARGKDTVMYREAIAEAAGLVAGMKEGVIAAGRIMRNAYQEGGHLVVEGKAEIHKAAFEGLPGKAIRTPFLLLEAADAFSKTINGYATAYAAAARASKGDIAQMASREFWQKELPKARLDKGVIEQMQADALRYTFQTDLSPAAKRLLGAAYNTPLKYILPFFLPFVRTPMNIYSEGVRLMPGLAVLSKRGRDAWAEGGAAREKMVADQVMGGAIAVTVIGMAEAGLISGSGPVDPQERAALVERGWQQFSIRVGDSWYSYARIEPFAVLIGTAIDLWSVRKHVSRGEYEIAAQALLFGFRQQVSNKSWLLGVSSMLDLATPDEYGGQKALRAAGDVLGGFIPNLGAQTDRELDSHLRDARSFVDKLQNRLPYFRRGLSPKVDSLGELIKQDSLFPFSGIRVTTEKGDPVREEMARIGYAPKPIRDAMVDVTPGPVKGELEMSQEQFDSFRTQAGQLAHRALAQVMQQPAYTEAPKDYKRALVEQVFAAARQQARMGVLPTKDIRQTAESALEKASKVK